MSSSRRRFLSQVTTTIACSAFTPQWLFGHNPNAQATATRSEPAIIGHGSHQYKVNLSWGQLDPKRFPVKDCHEMVQDSRGRILLLTNHTKNNVLVYDKSGALLESWGSEYPGAHGLTLSNENGEDFLWISDNIRHEVIKTTINGTVVRRLPFPRESGLYQEASEYVPTEVAVAPNGDVYVADGYGKQHILHYDQHGALKNFFGGRGDGPQHLDNAHGIALDARKQNSPTLLVSARQQNAVKRFSLAGELLEVIQLPGAYICRPVVSGKNVYFAVLISRMPWDSQSGFVLILDEHDKVTSAPGGSTPTYRDGKLQRLHQTLRLFKHPHDVCVDKDENLYVAQWNSGGVYPMQLVRV